MMRLQVEVMTSIEAPTGLAPLLDYHIFDRGLIAYSVIYMIYLLLAFYSPNTQKHVFMASTISIFFMAFFISSVVMVL